MSFSIPPNSASLDASVLTETIGRLRAESEAASSDVQRGLLLHEIGILEDLAHNDAQAARDLLNAVNTLQEFHEPLERLLILIERRKSYKNLAKLVDRLVKIAGSPEELARALVALAELREDHEADQSGAKEALERATQAKGDDVDAWLSLEWLAARTGDAVLRRRALAARAELARDPEWKALLCLDVARLDVATGGLDAAIGSIERAIEAKSPVTFAALCELERVGRVASRHDIVSRALEAQAALIERAVAGADDPETSGVPGGRRSAVHAADALLRAAELHREQGNAALAISLVDRVLERLPDDPVAIGLRLALAESTGDTAAAAALSERELERGVRGKVAASLWMRVAEAAASGGDAAAALSALTSALAEDPGCIPARVLELDLLAGSGNPAALGQALESAASELGTGALASELFLLAADTAARGAGDVSVAKAALSQAAAAGAPLEVVARTGRMLAAVAGDPAWFDEATRRVIATNPAEPERTGLWFEVVRSRLLRGDLDGASDAAASLAAVAGGAWLGNVIRAYAMPRTEARARSRGGDSLDALAEMASEPPLSSAFRVAASLRHRLEGDIDRSIASLQKLHEADPADPVVAAALATSYRNRGEPGASAETLVRHAGEAPDPAVGAALTLEAGIVQWLAGNRTSAIHAFDAAARRAPEAASTLLTWALRAAQPNDIDGRRKALEASAANEDEGAVAVERLALEVGADGDRDAVTACLGANGSGVPGVALDVARALLADAEHAETALRNLAAKSPEATALARAAEHMAALRAGRDARTLETSSATWADADPSLAAAVEWLGHAIHAGDADREVLARERIAERLGEPLGAAVLASARLVSRIAHDGPPPPLVPGSDPSALLANLELSPPSCDPRRRAAVLLDGESVLDPASAKAVSALAGWNLLAASDAPGAIRAFRNYLDAHSTDIVGWEGLRAAAELTQDKPLLAEASAALGDLVSDPGQGADLWERAAAILLDDLKDEARGEAALARAVERDIGQGAAFDRLFRIVRARRDGARLLELVTARLDVAEDPVEIAKLYWERARVLRETGDVEGAFEALENVTMLEPDHVGALALTGEIHIMSKRFAEAAESLARLSTLRDAPAQQRLMSGMAAVDLYENRLGRIDAALDVLQKLHRSGLATPPVRERLARAAAKAEAWDTATTVLEELMAQREAREGRIEAARLAMAVHRDRLGAPVQAEAAVERLLSESPGDGEALDLVLSGAFPKPFTDRMLQAGRDATVRALTLAPLDLDGIARLAEIARQLGDVQLRQVALGAVVALGGKTAEAVSELSALDRRVARVPQIAVDERVIAGLRDPEDHGAIPELFQALSTTLAEVLGPGLAALGVTKKERVRPQDGLPVRNEIAAWAGALGLGEFEVYIGGRDAEAISAVATEVPAIVVGAAVAAPLSAAHRAGLARELLGLKLGTTILRHRDTSDIAALVAAACNVAGVRVESPPYAMLAEFERLLSKELPRRVRKVLPDLASAVARSSTDPTAWVAAARASLDRLAAVAIGDVSWVLAGAEGGARGEAPRTSEGKQRAARLLSFALSPAFFAVRDKLGMGVK